MARGVKFPEADTLLGPPPGSTEEEVYSLPVKRLEGKVISCWELDPDEWAEVARTGRVWLQLWGSSMPPALVAGRKEYVLPTLTLDGLVAAVRSMPTVPVRIELGRLAYKDFIRMMEELGHLKVDPSGKEGPTTLTGIPIAQNDELEPGDACVVMSDGERRRLEVGGGDG